MSSETPAVSVILPTRNRARLLGRAARSVLDQTWRDLELIIVDDASEDETPALVAALDDTRVRSLRCAERRGAAGARNFGMARARGAFIAFQDSDDWWLPAKLARQMGRFDAGGTRLGLVYCVCRRLQDGCGRDMPPPWASQREGLMFEALLGGNLITTPTAVIRRETIAACGGGFDDRFPPLEDWEFFLRVARRYEVGLVDEPLVESTLQPDSISLRQDDYIAALERIITLYDAEFRTRAALYARHCGTLADRLCRAGRAGAGRVRFMQAWRAQPRRLGALAGWLLSFAPGLYRRASTWRRAGRTTI